MKTLLLTSLLATRLLAVEPLYTLEGTDPSFAAVQQSSGGKPGERFNRGGAEGSTVHVNHPLLEKQVGKQGPIPKPIGLHTEFSGGISRKDFGQWTRWYQEDGNVQVFRLFKGEQNIRGCEAKNGSPGRVEVRNRLGPVVAPGTWREYEATYTIIKPVSANLFQLFHEGKAKDGDAILWPFHIMMNPNGTIYFLRRNEVKGLERRIIMAEDMTGKSLSVKVLANGEDYEVYQKAPLDAGPWKLVTKGSYTKAEEGRISFRWGMYVGSKKRRDRPERCPALRHGRHDPLIQAGLANGHDCLLEPHGARGRSRGTFVAGFVLHFRSQEWLRGSTISHDSSAT